ncbi:MAG: NADH-quinone oxidoreductase subunit H [Planctomycetota bacterium]|nr:NADH-quinone oxidoreductase subunit H [Planctomycetota bacterium]MDA1214345.1 NADH-quinone oxidoreductase subunit H [Planctomycetota bacterium]
MMTTLAASTLAEFMNGYVSPELALMLAALFHAGVLLLVFAHAALIFIWLERKVSGRIQDRLGPTRCGGRFGWAQGLADGIKLIQKEDLIPRDADAFLFRLAPYLACIASFGGFMVLPFAADWVAVNLDTGLFLLFAILSLEVLGIVLAGYSSGSKWSLFGGMREAAQMVSYEIPLAICGLIPIVAAGTLNLTDVGQMQVGHFGNWFLFHDPFTFFAFFVYFTVATAGCKRAPFDLAEAESELVGGFHTEYSGMRWSYFFMAEYASMLLVSGVATLLFLGGWSTGLPFIDQPIFVDLKSWNPGIGPEGFVLGSYISNLIGMSVFLLKSSFLVFVQIWVRWTFPRLRIDQVMTTCLKYLVPMSCFLFLGATMWPLLMAMGKGQKTTIWPQPLGDRTVQVHEHVLHPINEPKIQIADRGEQTVDFSETPVIAKEAILTEAMHSPSEQGIQP